MNKNIYRIFFWLYIDSSAIDIVECLNCVCEAEIQSLLCNIPGMTDSLMIAMLLVMDWLIGHNMGPVSQIIHPCFNQSEDCVRAIRPGTSHSICI